MSRINKLFYPWMERAVLATGRLQLRDARAWADCKRVVFVCTGNICRSPYAEVLARAHGIEAISCGIDTRMGLPADAIALEEAALKGIDLKSHRTIRWEDLELRPGDLVIAMQLRHAKAVLPKAQAANCPVIMFSSLLLPGLKVIWDPYGYPREKYREVFELIDAGVQRIMRGLQSVSSHSHGRYRKPYKKRMRWTSALGGIVKDIIGRLLVAFGIHGRLLKGKAVAVAFHSITEDNSDGALRCSVRDFERYCTFFAKHLKVTTFSTIVEKLRQGAPLEGQLAITFDDGYADNAEIALPVLRRLALPATFFVATGFMGSEIQTPWDAKHSVRSRWMSWSQVHLLMEAGHEIGAHTVSHANLGVLSFQDAEDELCKSRDTLFEQTSKVPKHFALPFGRSFPAIQQIIRIVGNLGFESFSLCRGGVVLQGSSPLHIERWPINPMEYISPYGWIVDVLRDANHEHPVNEAEKK